MSPDTLYLFVYGSLRSGFKSPAYDYISRYFSFVSTAKVRGKLFDLGPYPAGVPDTGDHFVVGELYVINQEKEFPWAMGQLDDYEGITTGQGETSSYSRRLVEVFIENEKSVTAWIYWYASSVAGYPRIESGDLIQYLREKNSSATSPR